MPNCPNHGNMPLSLGFALRKGMATLTEWLVQKFLAGVSTTDSAGRTRYGQFAGIVSIVCNVVLCIAKGAVGFAAGSVSIIADAVNNLSDASSNIVALLGFKLASKPADDEHPYGHGRFEYLASLTVAALVLAVGINLVMTSIQKIVSPEQTEFGPAVIVVLALSMAVKSWMALFNTSMGKRISSETLTATAVDSRNDVITSGAVLTAAIVSYFTGFDLDGIAGTVVGAFICWSGFSLVRDAIDPLLGRTPDPALIQHIHDKIMSYPGVLGTHDLMVHDYGPGRQFASAHVEMAGEGDVFASHDLLDNIEQDFLKEGLVMTLHYDPIVTDDPRVTDMRHWISIHIKEIDPRLTIHDLRTVPGPTHTNVIFDVVIHHDCTMSEAELQKIFNDRIQEYNPAFFVVIDVDKNYVALK